MILRATVVPRRCGLVLGALVLVGSLSAARRDAQACGATPTEVQALLPLAGATNVPLNAVLISSSNLTEAVFELHELDGSGARATAPALDGGVNPASDAGAPGAVPLDVDCGAQRQGGGAVCLARPLEALKPNTRYAWQVNVSEGQVSQHIDDLSRQFTTGSSLDDQAITADAVSLAVTADHRDTTGSNDCGIDHWMEVVYTLRASEPAVLHFADYTPAYVMHATLLHGVLAGSSEAKMAAMLYSPPDCLAPVVYDVAGHRTALPEWCPGVVAAQPTDAEVAENDGDFYRPNSNSNSNSSSSDSSDPKLPSRAAPRARSGCALSMPSTSTPRALPMAVGLGLALLLVGRGRRRS